MNRVRCFSFSRPFAPQRKPARKAMAMACAETGEGKENPGLLLGALIGECQRQGRDKLTLICSPGIRDLGAWLEQLVAESTGKDGKAVIPVDREEAGQPDAYGEDRLFIYLRLEESPDPAQDEAIGGLVQAGQPVVQISLADRYDLAAEFFRWEFATAVVGSIMGVDPFNQPDVEASKLSLCSEMRGKDFSCSRTITTVMRWGRPTPRPHCWIGCVPISSA